jgi:MFS transporter, FHS family, L-fucose permease
MKQTNAVCTLLFTVYFIYFFCGLAQCFETVFIPEFKEFFHLNYQNAMYVNLGKNLMLVFSILIGFMVRKIGFKNCLSVAMFLYALGTILIILGLKTVSYGMIIAAFSIVGLGFSFQLVAGNPMLSGLGKPEGASSRLNLGNALGAVAWIVSPLVITLLIPASITNVSGRIPYMIYLFAVIAIVLFFTAGFTIFSKDVDILENLKEKQPETKDNRSALKMVWLNPRVILGFVTIFMVLGTEACIFSLYQNYLLDPDIVNLKSFAMSRPSLSFLVNPKFLFTILFSLYALGRLAASAVQRKINPSLHLVLNAVFALLLVVLIIFTKGLVALVSITLLGFFISIFFPTLYAIAIEGLGDYTGQASGLLTMGLFGGAVIPVIQGAMADMSSIGLQKSFALAFIPYTLVLLYVLRMRQLKSKEVC